MDLRICTRCGLPFSQCEHGKSFEEFQQRLDLCFGAETPNIDWDAELEELVEESE